MQIKIDWKMISIMHDARDLIKQVKKNSNEKKEHWLLHNYNEIEKVKFQGKNISIRNSIYESRYYFKSQTIERNRISGLAAGPNDMKKNFSVACALQI